MKNTILIVSLFIFTGTVYSQNYNFFPVLIPELYPYHNDPTTVYWREDQAIIPKKISRYQIHSNGDSSLEFTQRRLTQGYYPAQNVSSVGVYYGMFDLSSPTKMLSHVYDSLGRKVYYEDRSFVTNNPPHTPNYFINFYTQFYYHGKTNWLDSTRTTHNTQADTRTIFQYNQNDQLTSIDYYTLEPTLWKKTGYNTRHYNAGGQLTQIKEFSTQPTETLQRVLDLTYDNANRVAKIISTNVVTNYPAYKWEYTYNNSDSTTLQVQYAWLGGGWHEQSRKIIDLGFMGRVDANNSNSGNLTLKYYPEKVRPFLGDAIDFATNFHFHLYFIYATSEVEETGQDEQAIPLSVSPNPTSGQFRVESPVGSKLLLQDLLGRIVWQGISSGMDQVSLPAGTLGQFFLSAVLHGQSAGKMVIVH